MQRNPKDSKAKQAASEAFLRQGKPAIDLSQIQKGVLAGDRLALGRAITIVESDHIDRQSQALTLLENLPVSSKDAIRIGVSGPPGVGKSTFIEALGTLLIEQGLEVAVLAIDPSSKKTKGSILGDKTRMETLSKSPSAFIRPSPAGKTLGGVAAKTQETIQIVEAGGFDCIIIETVGVGQSEWEVYSMVDCFLLLLQPGGGDELQGIKKGVVEMADIIAVNKSDGEQMTLAQQTKLAYRNALHLFPASPNGWSTKVLKISALENEGIDSVWTTIQEFIALGKKNLSFQKRRSEQAEEWFSKHLNQLLWQKINRDANFQTQLSKLLTAVKSGKISPVKAAAIVFKNYSQTETK